MNPDFMREEVLYRTFASGQGFDWVTVFSLFLVGLFYAVPQMMGNPLTGRARGCFLGAIWVLVVKLFINLIRILLINLDLFNFTVGPRAGGAGGTMSAIVMLFFPVLEGMLFVLAMVLFVAGLPGLMNKDRWEPDMRHREEDRP